MNKPRKQFKSYAIIIEEIDNQTNDILIFEELIKALELLTTEYYVILHDKDVDDDDIIIRPHYHCVVETRSRMDLSALLNKLAKILNIRKERITLDYNYTKVASLRYLIHLDDLDKYQYAPFLITTNKKDILTSAFRENSEDVSTETLLSLILDRNMNKFALVRSLGLKQFKKNWQVINFLWEDRQFEIMLNEQKEEEKKKIEEKKKGLIY